MRILRKLVYVCCSITLGLMALSSCEGGELYDVNAPDWISEKVDSIADSKKEPEEEVLEGMQEDVYSFGNTDYTSGFWTAFSKYYVVPDGHGVFNLNINPADNTYYKNFALVITNDADRGDEGYAEYGAYRFDTTNDTLAYNSQWGSHLFFKYTSSTLMLSPVDNLDETVQKLGGKVTLTVDRTSENAFSIKIQNTSATKTYKQPYKLPNLNIDKSNTNIRCFLVPEGSYINFLQSNIIPIGGLTSAEDKNPLSMVLQNVPDQVNAGTSLEEAVVGITAVVSFEEGVTKTVTAEELQFTAIPNMEELGTKTLVAIYNKTFKGENCNLPVVANATFEVVEKIVSIQVTAQPTHTQYYYYTSAATEAMTDRTLAFLPEGLKVTATYADGSTQIIDNTKLSFSAIVAKAGTQTVTITADEATATVAVKVAESTVSTVSNSADILGTEDNTTEWWTVFSDNFNVPTGETKSISFTNYTSLANNWSNFAVVLRKADLAEYAVVRADNYGNASLVHNGTQGDWATWLADMNGAKVTVYVTNCGNGTTDIQAVMEGTSGTSYAQYYLGINKVDMNDLNFALTIEGGHLVF